MNPSLSHAYVKVRWARKQLKELESLCAKRAREFKRKVQYPKVVHELPNHGEDLFRWPSSRMPYTCHILAGQIANGLRSALDYLCGQLAELDSGSAKYRTQFPIESSAKGFAGRKSTFMHGLNAAHIAVIERLQPYNGCRWSERLSALSNLDKHNALIPVDLDVRYSVRFEPVKGTKRHPSPYKVRVYVEPAPRVLLREGGEFDLIEALREIDAGVTQTLDQFNPEF